MIRGDAAGMLSCSRNARPQKALVGRAQSRALPPHVLDVLPASKEREKEGAEET
jgi:hypothetical protein